MGIPVEKEIFVSHDELKNHVTLSEKGGKVWYVISFSTQNFDYT